MNKPTFKIHGAERRKLKKELAVLKSCVKNFWFYHQMDKDMVSFYGGAKNGFPMSDEEAQNHLDANTERINFLESRLSVPYEG